MAFVSVSTLCQHFFLWLCGAACRCMVASAASLPWLVCSSKGCLTDLWLPDRGIVESHLRETFGSLRLANIRKVNVQQYITMVRSSKLAHFAHLNWPICTSPDV